MRQLARTDIIIIARSVDNDNYRLAYLPLTLMASLTVVIAIITVTISIFTALDRIAVPVYSFLFVGWAADLALIWLAFRLMVRNARP